MFATVDICVVFGLGPSIHGTGIHLNNPHDVFEGPTGDGAPTNPPVPAG